MSRGYTKRRSDLPEPSAAPLPGLGSPAVIDYIKSLGVTTVELMPVHLLRETIAISSSAD